MKDAICDTTARLSMAAYRDLKAVVLTGSLARNEGTFVEDEQGWQLYGDAEFLLVFGDHAALPPTANLRRIEAEIEARIHEGGLRAEVKLSSAGSSYLRQLPPSIFAYELRACGEVVAGEAAILWLIPDFACADIPLEDAWRMLANRLVEQLESADELVGRRLTLSPRACYRTMKLYLDMATSLLVFAGRYAPTYVQRTKNLGWLIHEPSPGPSWPFPLEPFTEEVAACTASKLSGARLGGGARREFWERAIDHARALWRWELARLQGASEDASTTQLMMSWMQAQHLRRRLHGWAYVARQHGWRRNWFSWPRWARSALVASPRYAVYAAAAELMFALRSPDGSTDEAIANPRWRELRRRLPIVTTSRLADRPAWREVAADVLVNYHKFIVDTRA
jgi:hypothetical protein